jgi:acyl carrier protein
MRAEKIRKIMGAVFGIEPASIGDDASPGNVEQWDSLRHMNLVLALEEEFGVRFPEEAIDQLISFRLIELALEELGQPA